MFSLFLRRIRKKLIELGKVAKNKTRAISRIVKIALVIGIIAVFIVGLFAGFELRIFTEGKVAISQKVVAYPVVEYVGSNCTSGTLTAHFYYSNSSSYSVPRSAGYFNGTIESRIITNSTTITTCSATTTT
jgi:hypothetical protein